MHLDPSQPTAELGAAADLVVAPVVAGRYRLERPLARGGMSRVFVAVDTKLDRPVALKLLDPARFGDGADAERARRRFFQEARVLAALVHPNVVEIYDVGDDAGQVYMALRLIPGGSLGDQVRAGVVPPLAEALRVVLGIARALALAHRGGILHRDLKPDNVLLEAGEARVVDFGLARHVGAGLHTASGTVVGTPAYLAPELLVGAAPTPAADVFSGGVAAYEYLTAVYPFTRGSLIWSIAYEEPPAPRSVRRDIPPALEAVLLRMMAKRPEDRYPDFGEVLHDLELVAAALPENRVDTSALATDRLLAWSMSAERTELRLPFAGRDAELGRIERALAAAGAGRGAAVAVSGPAGIGKSRLVQEAVQLARLRQAAVYIGRAVETGGEYPYQPFVSLLRSWAEQHQLRSTEDLQKLIEAQGGQLRGATQLLAGLLALGPSGPRDRDQLWEAFALFFASLSGDRPAVVVLEDFHLADAASLALLGYLLPEVERRRLLLLATVRDEEGCAAEVADLVAAGRVDGIRLEPIGEAHVGRIVAGLVLDPDAAARLAPVVVRETDGNPLFVAELLKSLKEKGVLVAAGAGYALARDPSDGDAPPTLQKLITRRLSRLTREERELAEVVAVCGDAVALDLVLKVAGSDRLAVLRRLQALEREHHVLVAVGGRSWRFAHDRIRAALYAELSSPVRAEIHAMVGDALAPGARDPDAPLLARHFAAAGRAADAAAWHVRAGMWSHRNFSYDVAASHFERALADGRPLDDREVAACIESFLWNGRFEAAAPMIERLRASGHPESAARAALFAARLADTRGQPEVLLAETARGLDLLGEGRRSELAISLMRLRCQGHRLLGQNDQVRESLAACIDASSSGEFPVELAGTLHEQAVEDVRERRLDAARAALDRAERLASEHGQLMLGVRLKRLRGHVEREEGRLAAHGEALQAALDGAARLGAGEIRAGLAASLAAVRNRQGDFHEALRLSHDALDFARRSGATRLAVTAALNALETRTELGDLGAAAALRAEVEAGAGSIDAPLRDAIAINCAYLDCELGHLARAAARLEPLARPGEGPFRAAACLVLGYVAAARADHGAAAGWLAEAVAALPGPADAVERDRARCALAMALTRDGRAAAAETELARVVAATTSRSVARDLAFAGGEVARVLGRSEAAVAGFTEAACIAAAQGARLRQAEACLALAALPGVREPEAAQAAAQAEALVAGIAAELDEADRAAFAARRSLHEAGWERRQQA